MLISPKERLLNLFDGGIYSRIDYEDVVEDPLNFKDTKKYTDRIKETRKKTSEKDAMVLTVGDVGRLKVTVAVQNFAFMGGSMGMSVGNSIIAGVNNSLKFKTPFVMFAAAGGARMQEGALSLMQLSKISTHLAKFSKTGGLYISILTYPTTGGVTASFGMQADVTIAEPKALIGFAGQRVIKQTTSQELPDHFQTSEFLKEKGFIDFVVDRKNLKNSISKVLDVLAWKVTIKY